MPASTRAAVMNFLNEVAERYPSAISLASGRPTDVFLGRLDSSALLGALQRYERHRAATHGSRCVMTALLQYGRTAGMIEALVGAQIVNDELVAARADRLIVTAGCQEALALCIGALCPDPTDVALVCNPTYIGATGAADANRVAVAGLAAADGDIASSLVAADEQLRRQGRRARLLYLIPEFDNPTGHVIDRSQRLAILRECARRHIVVLEDNPYGMFRFGGEQVPPMALLDEVGSVIYLTTYSKTLCPGLRIGSLVLPDTLFGDRPARVRLFEDLTQRKSFLTVNTSQICQAMVAGFLLEQNCSLRQWVQPPLNLYRENRDTMLNALERAFASSRHCVRWNRPDGGFFLVLDVPFRFDADSTAHCALEYGVIAMPMSFFALDSSQDHRIRLAFSAVNAQQIEAGIAGLGRYVHMRMESSSANRVTA